MLQVLKGIRKMGGVGALARGEEEEMQKEDKRIVVEEEVEQENEEEEVDDVEELEDGSESGVSDASTDIVGAFEGIGEESDVEEEEVEEEEDDVSSDSEVESSAL